MPTSGSGSARRRSSKPNAPAGRSCSAHRLGAELRRLREACALRLEDAAAELGVAASTLSRIETGHAPARTSYVRILLDLYHVSDPADQRRLTDLAREGHRKGWWAAYDHLLPPGMGAYLGLETASALSRTYALQVIPALLQIPSYAIAAGRAARPDLTTGEIDLLAEVTRLRQDILSNGHHLYAVIDESALLRTVGSAKIMTRQIEHLRDLATRPEVTIQVLPLSAPVPALTPQFTLLNFSDPADEDMAIRYGADGQISVTGRTATVSSIRATFTRLCQAARSSDAPGQRDPVAGCKS